MRVPVAIHKVQFHNWINIPKYFVIRTRLSRGATYDFADQQVEWENYQIVEGASSVMPLILRVVRRFTYRRWKFYIVTPTMQAYIKETHISLTTGWSGKTKDVNTIAEQKTTKIIRNLKRNSWQLPMHENTSKR